MWILYFWWQKAVIDKLIFFSIIYKIKPLCEVQSSAVHKAQFKISTQLSSASKKQSLSVWIKFKIVYLLLSHFSNKFLPFKIRVKNALISYEKSVNFALRAGSASHFFSRTFEISLKNYLKFQILTIKCLILQ